MTAGNLTPSGPVVLFACGGSGGHVLPALAVAAELNRLAPEVRCRFVISPRPLDQQLLQAHGVSGVVLEAPDSNLFWKSPWRAGRQFWRAWQQGARVLFQEQPVVVVGTGGAVSLPVGFAAIRQRRPLLLIEPNAVWGRANACLRRWARRIFAGFPVTPVAESAHRNQRVQVTGVPLRRAICELADRPLPPGRRTLLIMGGSQGASELNSAVLESLPQWGASLDGWRIVHLTGSRDAQRVRERYLELGTPAEVLPFVSDMVSLYIQSGLAICRGGASTLAELACAGIPAVVYPHPGAVRQHQLRNAEQYASEGGVVVLHETAVPEAARELSGHLKRLLEETATRERMAIQQHRQARPRAAEEIAAAILKHFPG